jgi:16S rRNA (cytosine967-C5)-methyltransferase
MLPQENEEIAEAFSKAHPDFIVLPVTEELTRLKVDHAENLCSGNFLRLWPHRHGTDGFFAAVWIRK